MDEEASFSALLSSSTAPSRPSWDTPVGGTTADDPWANPFSDTTISSNPFATSTPFSSTILPPSTSITNDPSLQPFGAIPESPIDEINTSPYVAKLEEDVSNGIGKLPDPPSVIAAREQEQQQQSQSQNQNQGLYASSSFNTPIPTPFDQSQDINPFSSSSTSNDPANKPFIPPSSSSPEQPFQQINQQKLKELPSSLIDEDLMAESDPEQSLKKAFVKSTPIPRTASPAANPNANKIVTPEKKTYVFTPSNHKKPVKEDTKTKKEEKKTVNQDEGDVHDKKANVAEGEENGDKKKQSVVEEDQVKDESKVQADSVKGVESEKDEETASGPSKLDASPIKETPSSSVVEDAKDTTPTIKSPKSPTSIPLPHSNLATPTISRVPTPLPPSTMNNKLDNTEASSVLATPSTDRVSVSPLDAPSADAEEQDYGFKSLSIGGSALSSAPPVPEKEWGSNATTADVTSPPSSRFGGKGWGVLDDDTSSTQEDGLFGKGGPSPNHARSDLWGTNDPSTGWGETSMEDALASAGPSGSNARSYDSNTSSSLESPSRITTSLSGSQSTIDDSNSSSFSPSVSNSNNNTPTTSPRKKLSALPIFQITVSDPTKVGDPVRGYTVYTVKTTTTSPHYRKGNFSVLRRFSDFLWLLDLLNFNNPGIIIPPMPGKHIIGRFQDQFIETRRMALQNFLTKITNHPILQLDQDLKLFLESDSFAYDSKIRKQEIIAIEKSQQPTNSSGLFSNGIGVGSNKFIEFDDWFESRNNFLNSLENQLKNLSKSIDLTSKSKLELSQTILIFSESLLILSESDLGLNLTKSLKELNNITQKENELYENQAKSDVINLLNLTDEYIRFIQSVKFTFSSRIKSHHQLKSAENHLNRLISQREKLRSTGQINEKVNQILAEINEAEKQVRESKLNFENITKLIKSEFIRFEKQRIEEFKSTLESYLNDLIENQNTLIELWENFHKSLIPIVDKSNKSSIA
ncbi:uncharacterized protein L201_003456 [Kwoniella dendrophila CBS 6074]|uniref:PX domain-containing protein n=1 Tax=Kwoniella dendrophila CBS 6074 TaxID=1295534 RepID=A0AAX4JVH3_9TREE